MTSFGYSSGTATLEELTTFVAPDSTAANPISRVGSFAADPGDGGTEGSTCNPDAVEGYESTIELFDGFLAEYEAEAGQKRAERDALLVRIGQIGTNLVKASQELTDAGVRTSEARQALADSRELRERVLGDLERNTGAALVVVGGGSVGCGAGTMAGVLGGAPLGPGGTLLGGLGGAIVSCIPSFWGMNRQIDSMQQNADTLVRLDEEIIPRDEAMLEQREVEEANAQASYDALLVLKQELDEALEVVVAEGQELAEKINATRSTIASLREALAAYKEENDCP